MHRNPNKPYRRKWHEAKVRVKPDGSDMDSLMCYLKNDVDQLCSATTRMRRKRRIHIVMEMANKELQNLVLQAFPYVPLPRVFPDPPRSNQKPLQAILDGKPPFLMSEDSP